MCCDLQHTANVILKMAQQNPSMMTLKEYVTFRKQNKTTVRDQQVGNIEAMIENFQSKERDEKLEAISVFGDMLETMPYSAFEGVIQAGVVPNIIEFLYRHDFPQLQIEAVNVVGMFLGTSKLAETMVHHGAVPALTNLIHAPDLHTRAEAISSLVNIIERFPQYRDLVVESRGLDRLVDQIMENNFQNVLPLAVGALSVLCRGYPRSNSDRHAQVFHALQQLLLPTNEEDVLAHACEILQCLSNGRIRNVQARIMLNVCTNLVELFNHASPGVILPAVMAVANIVGSAEVERQNKHLCDVMIECLIQPERLIRLRTLLVHEYDESVKKAACQTLAFIIKKHPFEVVVNDGTIFVLRHLYQNSGVGIRREVAWAISVVVHYGNHDDIKNLSLPCIGPLCEMLEDTEVAFPCLLALQRLLLIWEEDTNEDRIWPNLSHHTDRMEDFNAVEKIVNLRNHGSASISSTARAILHRYWPDR